MGIMGLAVSFPSQVNKIRLVLSNTVETRAEKFEISMPF